jgi:hypothetical protein
VISNTAFLRAIVFFVASAFFASVHLPRSGRGIDPSNLSLMGFTLGKSTIGDVETRLGKAKKRKCSASGGDSVELCYIVPGSDNTEVIFRSGATGGWIELDNFELIANVSKSKCSACVGALAAGKPETDGGLKLGLTRQNVIDLLGAPKKQKGNDLMFEWQSRLAMTEEQIQAAKKTFKTAKFDPYFDVTDKIEVKMERSRVVELSVHHLVTY